MTAPRPGWSTPRCSPRQDQRQHPGYRPGASPAAHRGRGCIRETRAWSPPTTWWPGPPPQSAPQKYRCSSEGRGVTWWQCSQCLLAFGNPRSIPCAGKRLVYRFSTLMLSVRSALATLTCSAGASAVIRECSAVIRVENAKSTASRPVGIRRTTTPRPSSGSDERVMKPRASSFRSRCVIAPELTRVSAIKLLGLSW
jgi:hypothetical protein